MKAIRSLFGASATALTLAFIASSVPITAQAQAPAAPAAAMMTEKKVFEIPSYTTFGGKTIKNVKVGYESYGKLNGVLAIAKVSDDIRAILAK